MPSVVRHVQHNVDSHSSPAVQLQGIKCNIVLNYICTQYECSTPDRPRTKLSLLHAYKQSGPYLPAAPAKPL